MQKHISRIFLAVILGPILLAAGQAVAQPAIDPNLGSDGGLTQGVWSTDAVIGSLDAPVVIVEYLSWTCPHCANFHETAVKNVIMPLVEEGQVRYVTRDLLRNWIDLRVSLAARCEGVNFEDASDKLFAAQPSFSVNDPTQVNLALGEILGLEASVVTACLADTEMARWLVERTQEASQSLGANSTPTVFINGERFDLAKTPQLDAEVRRIAALAAQ